MSRAPRCFLPHHSYHITVRCNNQAFDLRRPQARQVILYALTQAKKKFAFELYGICVMSNHVHYLLKTKLPSDISRLMHWVNWYCAMLLNRLLHRRGHFWEERYHASAVPDNNARHVLTVLRYIHANPLAAKMITGFEYAYSNYRSYSQAQWDGISSWHPVFIKLSRDIQECAKRYAQFCRRYQERTKPKQRCGWGSWYLWLSILERPKLNKSQGGNPLNAIQDDLFVPKDRTGARYRGGTTSEGNSQKIGILRPQVRQTVAQFIHINQAQ